VNSLKNHAYIRKKSQKLQGMIAKDGALQISELLKNK